MGKVTVKLPGRRPQALPMNLPPRGLRREEAAEYIGVSVGKFDEMVTDGRMPQPKRIDARKVWDLRAVDRAFDALGSSADDEFNEWDEVANDQAPSQIRA